MTIPELMKVYHIHSADQLSQVTHMNPNNATDLWHGNYVAYQFEDFQWQLRHVIETITFHLGCPVSDLFMAYRHTRWGGFVYLIENSGNYKIGRSRNPLHRLQQLPRAYPSRPKPFILIHQIQTNNSKMLESQLHRLFSVSRLKGEWYTLTREEVSMLQTVKSFHYTKVI